MKKLPLMLVLLLAFTLTGFAANNKLMISYEGPKPSFKTGNLPQPTQAELYYDDGTAEGAWAFYLAGGEFGTWFTSPIGYPIGIEGIKWMIWGPSWPDGDREEIGLCIWDCNTYTKLWQVQTISEVVMPEWNTYGILPAFIVDGDFIGSIQQKTNFPDCEGLCVDREDPYAGRDGYYYAGTWYDICHAGGAEFGNWMIRILYRPTEGVNCKITLYQMKVPRGCSFDACLQFTNITQNKVTVTGDLVFKKGGVERKRIPIPAIQIQPGATIHKVYSVKLPTSTPQGADYMVEFQGTANGFNVACGPEAFEVIEAPGGFVDGPCPSDLLTFTSTGFEANNKSMRSKNVPQPFNSPGVAANNKLIPKFEPNPSFKPGDLPRPMTQELYYDDGTAENAWALSGSVKYGVWFTSPYGYPVKIDGFKWMIWAGWPDDDREEIGLCISDCNTYQLLWSTNVTSAVEMPSWNEYAISPPLQVDNDWIGYIQGRTYYPNCEGLCVDENGPYAGRDLNSNYLWSCYGGGAGFGNWMIRQDLFVETVFCEIVLYQVKIPKGSTFDFCLQFINRMQSKVTVTGDLVFKHGGAEKKRLPIPATSIQPGQTVHKIYCLNTAQGIPNAYYTIEFQGTAGGQNVFCGPHYFQIIEAPGGFVSGPCPCDP